MKRFLTVSTLVLFLSVSVSFAASQPPQLCYTATDLNISIEWTTAPGATGSTLYYAPYPFQGEHTIGSIDMGTQTSAVYNMWESANYYITVTSTDGAGESAYSNIEIFSLSSGFQSSSSVSCENSESMEGSWQLNLEETHWGEWSSELPQYAGSSLVINGDSWDQTLNKNGSVDSEIRATFTRDGNSVSVVREGQIYQATIRLENNNTKLTVYWSDGDIEVWNK